MVKYQINNRDISDTYRIYNIVSEEMIQMVNHNGKYIPQSEYNEIMDEITNQTYENLIKRNLSNKNFGVIIDMIV